MAFVVVDGTTVPVALGSGSMTVETVGDKHRAFDGTIRSTLTDQLRVWKVRSVPMPTGTVDTLFASLTSLSSQPLTCSGDLLGASISCYGTWDRKTSVAGSSGIQFTVEFTLEESS